MCQAENNKKNIVGDAKLIYMIKLKLKKEKEKDKKPRIFKIKSISSNSYHCNKNIYNIRKHNGAGENISVCNQKED